MIEELEKGGAGMPRHRPPLHMAAYVQLRYLATELAAPVPAQVLARLGLAALEANPIERDTALFGARRGREIRSGRGGAGPG